MLQVNLLQAQRRQLVGNGGVDGMQGGSEGSQPLRRPAGFLVQHFSIG